MKYSAKELFSVPNILSYIRLLLIPVFVVLYLRADTPAAYHGAALVILFSGLTDCADGFIARHFNQITEWGKMVDPIADKLTQAAIVFCLTLRYPGMWVLVALFVVKELFMGINGLVLMKKGKRLDGAKWFGKLSTAVFYVVMFVLIAVSDLDAVIVNTLLVITGFFLFLSFIKYLLLYVSMYRECRLSAKDTRRPSDP